MKQFIYFLIFSISFISNSFACSCNYSLKYDIRHSQTIFIGQIIEILDVMSPIDSISYTTEEFNKVIEKGGYWVKIKIEKIYKGKFENDTIVIFGNRSYSCSSYFSLQKKYLILADYINVKKSKFYTTSVCNHNKTIPNEMKVHKKVIDYFRDNQ